MIKYAVFGDVFWKKLAEILSKRTSVNKHAIELNDGKQFFYWPIYIIELLELETLKTYIKTNLANAFIQSAKSPDGALIFFVQKTDGIVPQYVNYWGLNNLTMKNQYLLLLIIECLDWLKQAKRFTELDFINAYHEIRIKGGEK